MSGAERPSRNVWNASERWAASRRYGLGITARRKRSRAAVDTASAVPGRAAPDRYLRRPTAGFVKEACAIVGRRAKMPSEHPRVEAHPACPDSIACPRSTAITCWPFPRRSTTRRRSTRPSRPLVGIAAGHRHHGRPPPPRRPGLFAGRSDVSRDPVGDRGGGHPAEPHEHRLRPGADHARPEHLVSDRPPARAGRARRAGGLGPNGYSFMGALRDAPRVEGETGPEVGRRLVEEGVDAALVTPT